MLELASEIKIKCRPVRILSMGCVYAWHDTRRDHLAIVPFAFPSLMGKVGSVLEVRVLHKFRYVGSVAQLQNNVVAQNHANDNHKNEADLSAQIEFARRMKHWWR